MPPGRSSGGCAWTADLRSDGNRPYFCEMREIRRRPQGCVRRMPKPTGDPIRARLEGMDPGGSAGRERKATEIGFAGAPGRGSTVAPGWHLTPNPLLPSLCLNPRKHLIMKRFPWHALPDSNRGPAD